MSCDSDSLVWSTKYDQEQYIFWNNLVVHAILPGSVEAAAAVSKALFSLEVGGSEKSTQVTYILHFNLFLGSICKDNSIYIYKL